MAWIFPERYMPTTVIINTMTIILETRCFLKKERILEKWNTHITPKNAIIPRIALREYVKRI
jgi:hypothetical protein